MHVASGGQPPPPFYAAENFFKKITLRAMKYDGVTPIPPSFMEVCKESERNRQKWQ